MIHQDVTAVRNSKSRVEAVVFPATGGFYFLDVRSAAPPVGPFPTRERAAASADINVELDRELDRMLTPMVGKGRCIR
jgi:hypothetical protein